MLLFTKTEFHGMLREIMFHLLFVSEEGIHYVGCMFAINFIKILAIVYACNKFNIKFMFSCLLYIKSPME